jgi:hypothetical protein
MMPHHRNMVRSQCHVLDSRGGAVARHALTIRFSMAGSREDDMRSHFKLLVPTAASRPGVVGLHLLQHEFPALSLTTEQKIRNSADGVADCVFFACGYDLPPLQELASSLGEQLRGIGVAPGHVVGLYSVSYSATPGDVA